jgi:alpha/beta superfamily hydrolase
MNWAETVAMAERARAEEPVHFAGREGALYGIYTPPAPDAPRADHCVMLPGHPRFGHQRMSVIAARVLAAEGFAALRFDFHGHGESDGRSVTAHRSQAGPGDVDAAVRFARDERGQSRFLLTGYCFDGTSALAAMPSIATAGALFAAPLVLYRAISAGARPARTRRPEWASRMRRWWRHPLTFPSLAITAMASADELRKPAPGNGCNEAPSVRIAPVVEDAIAALSRSGTPVIIIFGEDDPAYAEFKLVKEQLFAPLNGDARCPLRVEVWPGRVQSSRNMPALLERTIRWAREFHPESISH